KGNRSCDDVLINARDLQIPFRPALLHLESTRLVTCYLQIGGCFGMMSFQREPPLIIQDCSSKIARAKISIANIVKNVCAPLSGADKRFVAGDCFLEIVLRVALVRLCKFRVRFREYGRYRHRDCECRASESENVAQASSLACLENFANGNACETIFLRAHARKVSMNSSTSRRISGESFSDPLCAPLY